MKDVPRWVRVVTLVAVSVVAGVAAIVSYVHMRELATEAGEEWRADIIPLSVDGMLVAASMVMLVRRRAGLPAGWLPWFGLVLGIGASLAANVAAAKPDVLSWIVSGWPPAALAVSFELLILVTRDRETEGSSDDLGTRDVRADAEGVQRTHTLSESDESSSPDDRAAELIASGVGRRRLSKELEISEHQARELLAASRNGDLR